MAGRVEIRRLNLMWLDPKIAEGDIIAIQSTDKTVTNRKWKYDVGRFINHNEGLFKVLL